MNRSASTFLTVTFISINACGGPTDDRVADTGASDSVSAIASASSPMRTGCAWITEEEAGSALGQAMRYRNTQEAGCILDPAVDGSGPMIDFKVEDGTESYDFYSALADAQPVEALGDRAIWLAQGASQGTVVAVKGARTFTATISDLSGEEPSVRDRAVSFARTIVDRM